jgi:hypothetical protein
MDKLVPAMTTVKWKLFTKTGVDSSCSSFHKIITSASGICGDDCNKVFHETVIPKHQKAHIPVSEDGDEFLCHKCYKVKSFKSSRPSYKKWEEKSDYDEYGGDDDYIDELFGLIYKHKLKRCSNF